jgi:hypothetical protein
MKSTFTKSLIMTLVALIATTVSTSGLPSTQTGWLIFGITVLGTVLTYVAKNAAFPSTSLFGNVDLKDVASGLILALGSALSSFAASTVTGTPVDWHSLTTLITTVVVGYFAKNFMAGNKINDVRVADTKDSAETTAQVATEATSAVDPATDAQAKVVPIDNSTKQP